MSVRPTWGGMPFVSTIILAAACGVSCGGGGGDGRVARDVAAPEAADASADVVPVPDQAPDETPAAPDDAADIAGDTGEVADAAPSDTPPDAPSDGVDADVPGDTHEDAPPGEVATDAPGDAPDGAPPDAAADVPEEASPEDAAQEYTAVPDEPGPPPPALYVVGGVVSGLAGSGLVLADGDVLLPVLADGPFVLPRLLEDGDGYDVRVAVQPSGPGQTCAVANGAGLIDGAHVVDVAVSCTDDPEPPPSTWRVGGTVHGLASGTVVLRLAWDDQHQDLATAVNGPFTFPAGLADGTAWAVTVHGQPGGSVPQVCSVEGGTGTIAASAADGAKVSCSVPSVTVGGTVSGLAGFGFVLLNNGADPLAVEADGPFTFPTPIPAGSKYSVAVGALPRAPLQDCAIASSWGTADADVEDVSVTCTTRTYRIGGLVETVFKGSGLALTLTGGPAVQKIQAGPGKLFEFPDPLEDRTAWEVEVAAHPVDPDSYCRVENGSGVLDGAAVKGVRVKCQSEPPLDLPPCDPEAVRGNPPAQLAVGIADVPHVLLVDRGGAAWAWGSNQNGKLGLGTGSGAYAAPARVALDDVVEVAAGADHSLALLADGTVRAWGSNASGQLGAAGPPISGSAVPVEVGGLADVVAVAAGGVHSMALKADGRVFCWGGNEHGQAGIGEGPATVPWAPLGQVPGIADAVAIAAGRYHSLALLADGSLRVWGRVDQASVREPVPLAGPGCGTRVAARSESSVVLREGGSAWSVGGASPKRLAPGRTFAAIAPGLGVTGSGVVVDLATGDGVAGAPLASMAVAGDKLGAALALDGHPWTWGRSGVGALGRGFVTIESPAEPNLPPAPVLRHRKVTAVDAGPYHTAVVRDDGTLWVAGRLTSATRATGLQLVRGIDRVAKAAVGMDVVAVLRDDGSVWRVSLGGQAAVPVAGLGGVVATDVSMTYAHTLVLDTTGQVWCWGYNLSANCGLGHTDSPVSSPTRVPGLAGVVAIAAGELHSLALTADDRVWGWGKADAGRLGGALSGVQLSPATLVDAGGAPIRGLADVAADSYNSMGIKGDGSVVTWGSGDRGALGNGTDGGVALTPVAVPVSGVASALGSGKRIGAALVAAQVVAWGDWPVEAWPASPFVVGGAEAVVAMALGARHGVALTTDRAVLSWGWNDDAQLQNGGGAGVVAAPVICWDCGLPGCAADEDCAAPGFPFCDAATGGCVACRDDSHCTAPALPACVAGLGVCVACVGRSHCTDPALPACHENACVECTESTDCPAGEVCSASAMTCGPCSVDAECPGETPHCASSTGLCVECTSAGHCPAGESCLPDGTCGTCSEDAHCPTGKHCSEGRCVNCVDSLDCPGDLVCRRDLDLCLGWCNADDQCIKNPAKPACFLAYGSCVECTADVHCGGGKPACDQSSRVCVACTSNAQCGGEKPVCLAKSKCVECATNADCPSGKPVCDTSYYRCAVCKKDSDCPLPDSRCVTTPLTSEKACLEACTRNDPACPAGQACLYRTGSETLGFCGPASCTDFFADECGPLANCLPAGSGGTCVAAGYWGAGSQCTDHTGCYPGLLCLDRKCNVPACTPGGAPACVDGKTCIPAFTPSAMLDVGFCASECVPGAPGCWDSCRPTHVEVATGTMVWACLQETGTRTLGQSCTPGSGVYSLSCRAPNVCLGGPEGAFCREPCNPAAAPGESGCDGAVCTPLGDATLVGGCKPCVPFGGGGCEPGAWCSPDWYAPASGACVVLSGAEVGEGKPCGLSDCCAATCYDPTVRGCTCAADAACCAAAWPSACANVARSSCGLTCLSPVCGEGLLCVGGRCEVLCVPGAAAGAPGACAGGDYCARLSSGSTPLGIGECRPACDLAGGKLCDEGQACQSAVVTQATVDVCFAGPPGWPGYPAEAGEPCPLSAPSYGYCGDARVCVGSPATCTNLCLTKNGAFGAGHPDCSDGAETVCTKVFTTSSYGLCKAP